MVMSTRGTNFLHKWISSNVHETVGADIIKALGINSLEIEEDTGSVYEAILDAIVHHNASLAD